MCGWTPRAITSVLTRGKAEGALAHRREDGHVTTETRCSTVGSGGGGRAHQSGTTGSVPVAARKDEETDSSLQLLEGADSVRH